MDRVQFSPTSARRQALWNFSRDSGVHFANIESQETTNSSAGT